MASRACEITVRSFAKINLSIDVGSVRDDGYHPVDMIMHGLAFHDDVKVTWTPAAGTNSSGIEVSLTCNRKYLPTDSRNLAHKAALIMSERYGENVGSGSIAIHLHKRIPVAAGLAGGSGNGAAVVLALNELWGLGLTLGKAMGICAELGSDVPFCAMLQAVGNHDVLKGIKAAEKASSCARATGRGTDLEPLTAVTKPVVIAKPRIGVSTAEVYKGIDACNIEARPDNDRLAGRLNGELHGPIWEDFINVLEEYTLKNYKEVTELKELMKAPSGERKDPAAVIMSGSGPTVFAMYGNKNETEDAKILADEMRSKGYESYWTYTFGGNNEF